MQIIVRNYAPSPLVVFSVDVDLSSVDSMSKRERREGVVRPGVENSFYVPGVPSEFRIKDFNGATILTHNIDPRPQFTQLGSSRDQFAWSIPSFETVTSALSGLWTYRSFNPTYVTGDQTPQEEWRLIRAEAALSYGRKLVTA